MTAYRYVRLGLLEASKVDGTWRISSDALERFRAGDGAGPVGRGAEAPWAERLEARLVEGDGTGAWRVVEAAMASGADVRDVYLEMVAPAMVSIGARWADGEFDISVEHQATGIVQRIIGRLGPRFVRRGRPRGGLVIGAPTGEFHGLTTAMLADLLRGHGWEVTDLGPNSPPTSFVRAGERMSELRGIGVSATHPDLLPSVAETCRVVREALPDVLLVAGGRAFSSREEALALGADELALSAEHLDAMLAERA